MTIDVAPTGQAFGAVVRGINFSARIDVETIKAVRAAWLDHHVLVFPEQPLENEDLVRFAEYFGPIGEDPFFAPIKGHDRIAAIRRKADEFAPLFAEVWHSDWSFMQVPPAGTCLYGIDIPAEGGDTFFADQHAAWDAMPDEMRGRMAKLVAVHSAKRAYAKDGRYAEDTYKGSMDIRPSDSALDTQTHPLIRPHPETGRLGVFGGSYVQGFDGVEVDAAEELKDELREWLARPEFVYRHKWGKGMLVLWDNRCVLHRATGGYEGYDRLLHRLTIADDASYYS